jgi:hypothetical protein
MATRSCPEGERRRHQRLARLQPAVQDHLLDLVLHHAWQGLPRQQPQGVVGVHRHNP